jgi:hypothetical protein
MCNMYEHAHMVYMVTISKWRRHYLVVLECDACNALQNHRIFIF